MEKRWKKLENFKLKVLTQTFSSLKETKILNTSEYFEDEFKKSTFSFEKILFIISLFSKNTKICNGIFYCFHYSYTFNFLIKNWISA